MVSSCSPSITCRKISSREAPGGSGKAWVSGKQRLGHWGLAMSSSTVLIKRVTPVPLLTESKSFCWYDLHVHWLLAMILVSGFFASEQKRSMGSSESWNWDWNWNYRWGDTVKKRRDPGQNWGLYIHWSNICFTVSMASLRLYCSGYTRFSDTPIFNTCVTTLDFARGRSSILDSPTYTDLLLQWLQDHWSPKADLKIIFSGFLVSVFTWRSQINRKQKSTSK